MFCEMELHQATRIGYWLFEKSYISEIDSLEVLH